MLTVDDVLQKVEAYQRNCMSLQDFDRWFDDNTGEVSEESELDRLRIVVEAALAQYYYDKIGEAELRQELAAAVRPFGSGILAMPSQNATSSAAAIEFPPSKRQSSPLVLIAASAAIVALTVGDTHRPLKPTVQPDPVVLPAGMRL